MGGAFRLPAPAGRFLDRDRPLKFRFEGSTVCGFHGDTVTSALVANGIWMVARSFKYHRPRGPLTVSGRDGNALVQLAGEPNAPADRYAIHDGMEAFGQHYSGSLNRDWHALQGLLAPFLPVGFYYRAFFRPSGAWQKFWEPLFRARAGLGRVRIGREHPAPSDKIHRFCDIAVIGAGPAGLAAAIEAAKAGAEVMLVDENPVLGGSLSFARFDADRRLADTRLADLANAVRGSRNVNVLSDAVCTGLYADNWLSLVQGDRLIKLRARRVVLATGSLEQPVVFRNNDLPGIVLGSGAQRLIRLYGIRPGRRAVVVTGNDMGYGVALDLAEAGVEIGAIADLRPAPVEAPLMTEAAGRGMRILAVKRVDEARPAAGGTRVGSVVLDGESFECDLVCMSPGYVPEYHLAAHAGARVGYDEARATFTVQDVPDGVHLAGALNGLHGPDAVVADGRRAGWEAARAVGLGTGAVPAQVADRAGAVNVAWPIFPHPRGREFVDLDEDLTIADVANALGEGYTQVELLKRFSTLGMGPSQGRQSALAAARLIARHTGRPIDRVGVTTARPPVVGEKLAVLAGRNFQPERRTPMHDRHIALGAQMFAAGPWWRPAYYGQPDERDDSIEREIAAVHEGVGMIDVSTLGKIEVRGPDAASFLDRIATLSHARQPIGRIRYLLLLNEAGTIVDDGVAARLGEQRFYLTATTGGADNVFRQMLWWNAQWRLKVDLANVTAGYAAVNVAGPRSRQLLSRLAEGIDLGAESFPYLAVRECRLAGIPARLLRIGFVGELGYEIHVPSQLGEALWDVLAGAGRALGIRPVGIEAQRVLRLEKGHIVVGQDTDGLTTPLEAGMQWALGRGKEFFVGARSVELRDRQPQKRRLVGFSMPFDSPVPRESCLVVEAGEMAGVVTSASSSRKCGKVIGLAYVRPDRSAPGTVLTIRLEAGRDVKATVTSLPFYDPDGEAQMR
jgi:sarcosine oxidase subunit alpha